MGAARCCIRRQPCVPEVHQDAISCVLLLCSITTGRQHLDERGERCLGCSCSWCGQCAAGSSGMQRSDSRRQLGRVCRRQQLNGADQAAGQQAGQQDAGRAGVAAGIGCCRQDGRGGAAAQEQAAQAGAAVGGGDAAGIQRRLQGPPQAAPASSLRRQQAVLQAGRHGAAGHSFGGAREHGHRRA